MKEGELYYTQYNYEEHKAKRSRDTSHTTIRRGSDPSYSKSIVSELSGNRYRPYRLHSLLYLARFGFVKLESRKVKAAAVEARSVAFRPQHLIQDRTPVTSEKLSTF